MIAQPSHLMQEGLKHIPCLRDSYDAGSPGVVDAIMEVINATGIHDLLSRDVWASQLANAISELCHRSVILGSPKQAHVSIRQVLWHWQCLAIRPNKRTCICQSMSLRML
jgi:hypothetical protein